jgi:hypothetical protein
VRMRISLIPSFARRSATAEPEAEPEPQEPDVVAESPEPEKKTEPEPKPQPILAAVPSAPEPEPDPEPEPEAEPEPEVVPLALRDPTPRVWNLWALEQLASTTDGEPEQVEERALLLLSLREFANAAGELPADFDPLVREAFGANLAKLVT